MLKGFRPLGGCATDRALGPSSTLTGKRILSHHRSCRPASCRARPPHALARIQAHRCRLLRRVRPRRCSRRLPCAAPGQGGPRSAAGPSPAARRTWPSRAASASGASAWLAPAPARHMPLARHSVATGRVHRHTAHSDQAACDHEDARSQADTGLLLAHGAHRPHLQLGGSPRAARDAGAPAASGAAGRAAPAPRPPRAVVPRGRAPRQRAPRRPEPHLRAAARKTRPGLSASPAARAGPGLRCNAARRLRLVRRRAACAAGRRQAHKVRE
jgi:hypothetical protein